MIKMPSGASTQNFNAFPDPKSIQGTKYYYSCHNNGCADMDWVSDLFYINNFKAERIGMIDGVGCGSDNVKIAIYIYSVKKNRKSLFKVYPMNTIEKYKKYKWALSGNSGLKSISCS
jgi:hypothetical protein